MRWIPLLFLALPAMAEDRLLYLSLESTEESSYGGVGWMAAPRGLDRTGPVWTLEVGRSFPDDTRLGAMAGWRWLWRPLYVTTLLGLEQVPSGTAPAATLDLWWNDADWMASGRLQAVKGPDSGRIAAGRRFWPDGPWFGPEATATWQGERLGLHATGIGLPFGFDARVSVGTTVKERAGHGGGFVELSLWRRF